MMAPDVDTKPLTPEEQRYYERLQRLPYEPPPAPKERRNSTEKAEAVDTSVPWRFRHRDQYRETRNAYYHRHAERINAARRAKRKAQ